MINPLGGMLANLAENFVETVTGSEALGDIASGIVNLSTGNFDAVVMDGLDLAENAVDALTQSPAWQQGSPSHCPAPGHTHVSARIDVVGIPRGVDVDVDVHHHHSSPVGRGRPAHVHLPRVTITDVMGMIRSGVPVLPDFRVHFEMDGYCGGFIGEPGESTAAGGADGSASASSGVGGSSFASKLFDIINNPNLSIEDKIAMLFAEILNGTDSEVEGKMRDLAESQKAKAKAEAGEDGQAPTDGQGSAADISKLSNELQMIMQRRSQMQALVSNLMNMTHQSAMQVIGNIR